MGNDILVCMEDGKVIGFLSRIIKAEFQEVNRLPPHHTIGTGFIQPDETRALGLWEELDGRRGALCLVAEWNGE
jgi:hypothetical protein